MRYAAILAEKGIRTASVDMAARKAVTRAMDEMATLFLDRFAPDWSEDANPHRVYEKVRASVADPSTTDAVSDVLSKTLSDVTSNIAISRFRSIAWSGLTIRPTPKASHGWFHPSNVSILLMVNDKVLRNGLLGRIESRLFGEDAGGMFNILLEDMVPTFIHEYAHLEQHLRGSSRANSHSTLLPAGAGRNRDKEGKRRGKRGGHHTTPEKSEADWLRYKGAKHEIDAFAAQAASQIIMRAVGGEQDWNWNVRAARQNLGGWHSGHTEVEAYRQIMRGAFADAYPGVRPEDGNRVWSRFVRKVYQKMEDYLRPQAGKATDDDTVGMRPEWVRAYKTESRIHAFNHIAHDVAKAIRLDHPIMPLDKVHARIADGQAVSEQEMAEDFIRKVYFGGWQGDPDEQDRAIALFRRLLTKRVR